MTAYHGTYTIFSAEIAEAALDQDAPQEQIEGFANEYAEALEDAFDQRGLDITVRVVHKTTGVGAGFEPSPYVEDRAAAEYEVKDISDRVLSTLMEE